MIGVLVVDDDYRVARLHARYAGGVDGFEVVGTAHTAREAVELDQRLCPDLVLLDQYLPDRLGTSVLPELRADVIMLTAAADAEQIRQALGGGAVGYLIKPFDAQELTGRLRSYARFRAQLGGDRTLDQEQVDRALRALYGTDRTARARRGRSSPTAGLIADAVRHADRPVTASELAAQLGLSRPTAQRYLADLSGDGAVRVELRYGAAGRPEHLYRWNVQAT
ncbi:response regulator [Streptomyces sp. RPT161]|uniref:response regulator n=1 Tax=Streptomyces sp. RPT161 TaxID=3015993 RepID=UPI0022B924AB|nr:response regulator [Streptomyces sp. RPT161]